MIGLSARSLFAEKLYIDSRNGSDANPGDKKKPLQTITKAAELVNSKTDSGPTVIKIEPGVYNISKCVLFKNDRPYTEDNRLTIEASILPDDPNWLPKFMPVIISTEPPSKTVYETYKYSAENATIGLKAEVSHATIRGLKFLGNPAEHTWHYPIFREGDNLTDLVVTQCLFTGDTHTVSYLSPICAKGDKIIADHCIFYNCHTPLIFWDAKGGISKGCAVRYCIIDGAAIAAVWTTQTAEDLEFHHNIITRSNYVWMRGKENQKKYCIRDSIITNCTYNSGYGDAFEMYGQTGSEISFIKENVVEQGNVYLQDADEKFDKGVIPAANRSRDYLHVMPGTLGSDLGAGLFQKNPASKTEKEQNFIKITYPYKKVGSHEILADVYLPVKTQTRPLVIYIHGGGFMFGSRSQLKAPLRDKLIAAGYTVVSIDYRLAPATRLDEILEDVKDACIWVRQKGPELFNIDSQRIAVMGGSAGGMLAMAAGYIVHPHPQALVDVSGVSDLESLKKMNGDPSLLSTNDLYQMLVKKVDSQGGQDRYKTCLTRVYGSRKSWALNPNPISKDMTP
jgi:hypothetical protein